MAMVSNYGLKPEQLLMALWNGADKNTRGPRKFRERFPYTPIRFTVAQLSSKSFGDYDGRFYEGIITALSLRPEDFRRDPFGNLLAKKFESSGYDHLHGKRERGKRVTAADIARALHSMNRIS